jgi:1-deoxy-D-xylulose-5-phosphate reductoisomerase
MPAVMAAADEIAVERFMRHEIGFLDIPAVIEDVMTRHETTSNPDLETVLGADAWARRQAATARSGATA